MDNPKAYLEQSIKSGYFSHKPFSQRKRFFLVLETSLAGLRHNIDVESPEGAAILAKIVPGTELVLVRDIDNEHDLWAIAVYTQDNIKLGYITRFKTETIARLMEDGKRFHAIVDRKRTIPKDSEERRRNGFAYTEGQDIFFSVYMEEW